MIYYTEYPTTEFKTNSDKKAIKLSKAKVIYRESDSIDGRPFIIIREMK